MENKKDEDRAYSFRELFAAYSKFGDSLSNGKSIKLIQSDKWMKTAGLFDGTALRLADTLIIFVDLKSDYLDYKEYQKFIKKICDVKKLNFGKVKEKLEKAGLPKRTNLKETWDFSIVNSKKNKKEKYNE